MRKRALEGDLLIVSKTNRLSRVHRRVRMDYVGVRRISAQGEIVGEARMLGLFTTKAYAEPSSQTPLLHRKLRQILRHEDLIEGSHDYKAAVSLFDSFPKDELFAASTDDLRGAVVALLALQGEQVRLLGRRDPDSRSASLIVALPRSRYDGELLERLIDHFRDPLQHSVRRLPPRARRGRPRADPLPRARLGRPARPRLPRARGARSSRSPAPGTTSCATA